MGRSVAAAVLDREVNPLDSIRPRPASAGLAVHTSQSTLRSVIAEAVRRAGSQKAAAIDMRIDPAQLARQLQNGHLTIERLEALPPVFAAELGRLLVDTFGPLATPQARLRQKARELRDMASEFDQLAEFVA